MIINMAGAGNFHGAANLTVSWRHTLLPRVFDNELEYFLLNVTCVS